MEEELKIVGLNLIHDNLVVLHEHFTISLGEMQGAYIVMEYCEEKDLSDFIIREAPDMDKRFKFLVDISRGLIFLHSQAIIHRDIKPENILLKKEQGELICKITDFGLSKLKASRSERYQTFCGTAPYMAPEILDGDYSNAVDVYALGLVFFVVHNITVIKLDDKVKLIPVKILPESKYKLIKQIMRNEKPTKDEFVQQFFKESVVFGHLVFSMIQTKPDTRPLMDEILVTISEIRVRNEMNQALQAKEENLQHYEKRLKEQESLLLTQDNELKEKEIKIEKYLAEKTDLFFENMKLQNDIEKAERNDSYMKKILEPMTRIKNQVSDKGTENPKFQVCEDSLETPVTSPVKSQEADEGFSSERDSQRKDEDESKTQPEIISDECEKQENPRQVGNKTEENKEDESEKREKKKDQNTTEAIKKEGNNMKQKEITAKEKANKSDHIGKGDSGNKESNTKQNQHGATSPEGKSEIQKNFKVVDESPGGIGKRQGTKLLMQQLAKRNGGNNLSPQRPKTAFGFSRGEGAYPKVKQLQQNVYHKDSKLQSRKDTSKNTQSEDLKGRKTEIRTSTGGVTDKATAMVDGVIRKEFAKVW